MKTKIISFISGKGGVGKSSCTILTANFLAELKKTVLVIDTDYSNSTTMYYLETKAGLDGKGFTTAIKKENLIDNIVPTRKEHIDIIPSNNSIEKMEIKSAMLLKTLFMQEEEFLAAYDYILIDTSQGYTTAILNAVYASDLIFTPVLLSQLDIMPCMTLQSKLDEAGKINSWGILFNSVSHHVQNKKSSHFQYIALYKKIFTQCLNIYIPNTAAVSNYIDRDIKITNKKNTKLVEGIKAIVEIILQESVETIESF